MISSLRSCRYHITHRSHIIKVCGTRSNFLTYIAFCDPKNKSNPKTTFASSLINLFMLWRKKGDFQCCGRQIYLFVYMKGLPGFWDMFPKNCNINTILCSCSLSVLWLFSEYSLSVLWKCSECSLIVVWMFSECTLSVLWVCSGFALSLV